VGSGGPRQGGPGDCQGLPRDRGYRLSGRRREETRLLVSRMPDSRRLGVPALPQRTGLALPGRDRRQPTAGVPICGGGLGGADARDPGSPLRHPLAYRRHRRRNRGNGGRGDQRGRASGAELHRQYGRDHRARLCDRRPRAHLARSGIGWRRRSRQLHPHRYRGHCTARRRNRRGGGGGSRSGSFARGACLCHRGRRARKVIGNPGRPCPGFDPSRAGWEVAGRLGGAH